jgi:hypothetical protein
MGVYRVSKSSSPSAISPAAATRSMHRRIHPVAITLRQRRNMHLLERRLVMLLRVLKELLRRAKTLHLHRH